MKLSDFTTLLFVAVIATACVAPIEEPARQDYSVFTYQDDAINAAIIQQKALFPYHFQEGSVELNALGQHDLQVLARHYQDHPTTLTVRRGGVNKNLYMNRVDNVKAELAARNVNVGQMTIVDEPTEARHFTGDEVGLRYEKMNKLSFDEN